MEIKELVTEALIAENQTIRVDMSFQGDAEVQVEMRVLNSTLDGVTTHYNPASVFYEEGQ